MFTYSAFFLCIYVEIVREYSLLLPEGRLQQIIKFKSYFII